MRKFISIALFLCAVGVYSQTVTIHTGLEYKVNLPSKKTNKIPVLIMLHGYGSNEADLFDISKSLDERFLTFSLRAPYSLGGQGFSWYQLDYADGKKKHNYEQAKESREKILDFISAACRAYKADSTQVFIMGFSQGSIMAYDIALSKPEKVKGILGLSGLILDGSKKIKINPLKMEKVKFFIAHGTQDNIIDFKLVEEAAKFIREKKGSVTFKSYEMPHSVCGAELNDMRAWLKSNLEKEKKEGVGK